MIINHYCCIKLVPLVIFIYDARSHIHQIRLSHRINLIDEVFFFVIKSCIRSHSVLKIQHVQIHFMLYFITQFYVYSFNVC